VNKLLLILCFILSNITSWAQNHNLIMAESNKPFILGQTVELQSKVLNQKRTVNIYLPEGYNAKDTTTYPVIYLLDGAADEDFIHVVGLVQFGSFEWINQIPKSIVVGITTPDRKRDYTFPTTIAEDQSNFPSAGHSEEFMTFIENELQPFIENSYHTKKLKTIIGQSLGGLFVTELLFKKPGLFNNYIIVSPSIWWDNASILSENLTAFQTDLKHQINVYIAVGKEGLTPTKLSRVMEVDANLLYDKIKTSLNQKGDVYFDYLPEKNHANILHQALSNAFGYLFDKQDIQH